MWEEENQLDATQCFIELVICSTSALRLTFRPPATRNYTPHGILAV